jgi:hypothetical protein
MPQVLPTLSVDRWYAFVQQKRTPRENAGNILINALSADCTEPRITESLPWATVHYFGEIDWDWLITGALNRRIQNRLGLIVISLGTARRNFRSLKSPARYARLRNGSSPSVRRTKTLSVTAA